MTNMDTTSHIFIVVINSSYKKLCVEDRLIKMHTNITVVIGEL